MKGIALFIGGPLDEELRVLPDLPPVYRVPVKDRRFTLKEEDLARGPSYGILEYRRTRTRFNDDGPLWAIYEVDL